MRFTEVTRLLGSWRVASFLCPAAPRRADFFAWLVYKTGTEVATVLGRLLPDLGTRSNPQSGSLAGYFLFLCSVENLTISHTSVATPTITSRSCKTSEIFAIITTPLPCGREFMFQKVCFRSLPSSGFGERTAISSRPLPPLRFLFYTIFSVFASFFAALAGEVDFSRPMVYNKGTEVATVLGRLLPLYGLQK